MAFESFMLFLANPRDSLGNVLAYLGEHGRGWNVLFDFAHGK